jgi:hypothetical protein
MVVDTSHLPGSGNASSLKATVFPVVEASQSVLVMSSVRARSVASSLSESCLACTNISRVLTTYFDGSYVFTGRTALLRHHGLALVNLPTSRQSSGFRFQHHVFGEATKTARTG